jgi:hypothetical protein
MKTEAQIALDNLLTAIDAAEPGPIVHLPEGANMFTPGKVCVNLADCDADDAEPIYRPMTETELAQEAAEAAWCAANRRHYDLTEKADAAAKAAFDSLPQEAQVAFLKAGPHRWAGGEDARFARFKVVLAYGGTEVARLGATGESTDARILISAAPHGVDTDELIARLAQFEF